jgi:DNA-binding transcriptional ArsR family regulator
MQAHTSSRRAARRDAVFRALADPTRRAMLDRLRDRESSVGELAEPFAMSQPAVSQHLKVLAEAGLVRARRDGRQRVYRLRPAPLREAFDWLERYARFWGDKLDALGAYLDRDDDDGRDDDEEEERR